MGYKFNPFTSNLDLDDGAQGPAWPTWPAGPSGTTDIVDTNETLWLAQILNGKISATINGSGDLVVSLLTTSNATPSSGSPVIIQIDWVQHSITSAFSTTATHWSTHWLALTSGASTLLSVYIGYSSTTGDTGVYMIASRIAGVLEQNNIAISGTVANGGIWYIHTPQSTDQLRFAWMFNATLTLSGSVYSWTAVTPIIYSPSIISLGNRELIVGDMWDEDGSIIVDGSTYNTQVKVSQIGGVTPGVVILHRHSTTQQDVIAMSLSNSDDTSHVDVSNGQIIWSVVWLGTAWDDYKIFTEIDTWVDDTGTVSQTSSPGKISIKVTPDGSISPEAVVTYHNDKTTETFGTDVNKRDGVYAIESQDSSKFRRFTWSTNTSGTLPQAFGGVILMDGYMHNTSIDNSWNFLWADDDGPCQCRVFDEMWSEAMITSATTTAGQVPWVYAPWVVAWSIINGIATYNTLIATSYIQWVNNELVQWVTTATSITPNADITTIYRVSALATNLTINAPTTSTSGYPGQKMEIWITSDSTGWHSLTWTGFSIGDSITPPSTIAANKRVKVWIEYDDINLSWDIVGYPGTY